MDKKILNYQNKYNNRDVLFLGTGTSLLDHDLNNINPNIIIFGFNHIIPFCQDFWPNLTLDFFMCHDSTVLNMSYHKQQSTRDKSESSYGLDLNTPIIHKYKDISPATFIADTKLYGRTKIIICSNIKYPHAVRFDMKQNSEWMEENPQITSHENFLTYKIKDSPAGELTELLEVKDDGLNIELWAKNSFLNCGLPMLFFLGFKNIYLTGVDFSGLGNFFCKTDGSNPMYVDREYKEFQSLMGIANSLPHKPNIFTLRSDKTKVFGKDGIVDFGVIKK